MKILIALAFAFAIAHPFGRGLPIRDIHYGSPFHHVVGPVHQNTSSRFNIVIGSGKGGFNPPQ